MNFTRRTGFLLVLMYFSFSSLLSAQENLDTLSVSLASEEYSLTQALQELAGRYQVRFFYEKDQIQDIPVQAPAGPLALAEMLGGLLRKTKLGFLLYRDQAVIIGERRMLDEALSTGYYQALEQLRNSETRMPGPAADTIIVVGSRENLAADGQARLKGTLTNADTRQPVVGGTIYFPDLASGTTTDADGTFNIELPVGAHALRIQSIGYEELNRSLKVYDDGSLDLQLAPQSVELEQVIVEARAPDANIAGVQIGVNRLDIQVVRELPSFLGEADVVRSLLLQPGVSTVGEGATGFNVRGGAVDQNLIMQDEGFLFNSSHALGFFSTFNADMISEVSLFKGNIPAQYGGRLASVLDVELRDGSFEKFGMKGGLSPVTARLSIEQPVVKEKSSLIVGGRAAYSDWVLDLINNPDVQQSAASFYDINGRYTHRLDDRTRLSLSGYRAFDRFRFADQFGYEYSTDLGQLTLRNIFNEKLFSRFSLIYSRYESTEENLSGGDASRLNNDITYLKAKEQLTFTPGKGLSFEGGLSAIRYWVSPGAIAPAKEESTVADRSLEEEHGLETGVFAQLAWELSPALSLSGGLRFAWYAFLGPKTVFDYSSPLPDLESLSDTTRYSGGALIQAYHSLEPRLSFRYRFSPSAAVKAGYSRTAQFINQISNTAAPTPSSLWQLSTPYIEPQRSHNLAAGLFRNFGDNRWESSVEIYYRVIDALFDYRNFADLSVNPYLETELRAGRGRSYGLELSLQRTSGRISGWISYTLSRTERKVGDVNRNHWYPSNFDAPHDLSVVANIQFSKRHRLSLNFNFRSGRPVTAPISTYQFDSGLWVPNYSARNQLRIPDYHRLDLAYTFGEGFDKTKKFKTSWTVSVYNVYGRRNPFSVYFIQRPFNEPETKRLSVLGGVFPSVTFNFEVL